MYHKCCKEGGPMTQTETKSRMMLIISMTIFGTIGILRRYIPLSSGVVALVRAVVGTLFLLLMLLMKRRKPDGAAIRKNLPLLLISGVAIGINWILLFESYNYTSVATATLCYYLAPILVILAAPIVLKEKMTVKKAVCAAIALAGMVLVSGLPESGFGGISEMRGILFGLGAAVLYASVILMNKRLTAMDPYDKTLCQLAVSAITLLPYVLLTENMGAIALDGLTVILLLVAGIVHTGFAYSLYFGSMPGLKAQTIALFSYIDPILAIVLSTLLLREPMTLSAAIGAVMILCAAFFSEQ